MHDWYYSNIPRNAMPAKSAGFFHLLSAWLFDMEGSLYFRLYESDGVQTDDIAFVLVERKK